MLLLLILGHPPTPDSSFTAGASECSCLICEVLRPTQFILAILRGHQSYTRQCLGRRVGRGAKGLNRVSHIQNMWVSPCYLLGFNKMIFFNRSRQYKVNQTWWLIYTVHSYKNILFVYFIINKIVCFMYKVLNRIKTIMKLCLSK